MSTIDLAGGGSESEVRLVVHHRLSIQDNRGEVVPQLAAELPSRANGTWIVRPDGSMRTTFKLRGNAVWHDGTPVTARDFVFGWRVTSDPAIPVARRDVANQIARVEDPDDGTLAIEWKNPYPFANAIGDDDLGPLPAHLLEAAYQSDRERFGHLPYWTREFVGAGPYRLAQWELGSHLVVEAFDHFYAGRPMIDTIVFRVIPNQDTVVASLLAGALDGDIGGIEFSRVVYVKEEWERTGRRPVALIDPIVWAFVHVNHRDPRPRELQNPSVRRGLLYALDRQAIVDAMFSGAAPVADSFIPPGDHRSEWIRDVATRHGYDPRRAEELFTGAGWRRGPGGGWVDASGERVPLPFWYTTQTLGAPAMADNWKSVGLEVDALTLSRPQFQDRQFRASFPGVQSTGVPLTFGNTIRVAYGPECPTEANRWLGSNHGCYRSPEHDFLIERLHSTLEPDDQRALYR